MHARARTHTHTRARALSLSLSLSLSLLDVHTQNLSSAIFENSHSTTYRIFKQSLHFEKYLTDLPKKERIVLCRFRCANHHLPIVSGRYSNIPRNMRFCNLCNLQSLGDEFHYLFECPFFANDRNLFLKDISSEDQTHSKWINSLTLPISKRFWILLNSVVR